MNSIRGDIYFWGCIICSQLSDSSGWALVWVATALLVSILVIWQEKTHV